MKHIGLLLAAFVLFGCQNVDDTGSGSANVAKDERGVELLPGVVYRGVLPCADCAGIETTLTLKRDKRFEYVSVYRDRQLSRFTEQGRYQVSGNILTLTFKDRSTKLSAAENRLLFLDADGKPYTGELAPYYQLIKQ